MAVLADICRVDVVETLAILDGAVVAADAIADNAVVAERCRQPRVGRMTVATFRSGGQMTRRQTVSN